jgi:hypothetical protein
MLIFFGYRQPIKHKMIETGKKKGVFLGFVNQKLKEASAFNPRAYDYITCATVN